MLHASDVPIAVRIAFARPWAYMVACAGAVAMALLLVWSSGLLVLYPTGWEVTASPEEWVTLILVSMLFGMLTPLECVAILKARSAAGTVGGLLGAFTGVLSVSCCAPLLIPAVLSFVGVSGTALIAFNLTVRDYLGPLALLSVALMAGSIVLVAHSIAATCDLPLSTAAPTQHPTAS